MQIFLLLTYRNSQKNPCALMSLPISPKMSLSTEHCHAHGDGNKLFKILICVWKLQFYHWQQILLVVFLKVTGSLHSGLKENVCQIPKLELPVRLSDIFKQKKGGKKLFLEKKAGGREASSAHNSITRKGFLPRQPRCVAEAVPISFSLFHPRIKRCALKG